MSNRLQVIAQAVRESLASIAGRSQQLIQRIASSSSRSHARLAAVALAWVAAFLLRFNFDTAAAVWHIIGVTLPWVLIVHTASFYYFGLYRGLWRFASLPDLRRILLAVGLAALVVPLLLFLVLRLVDVPRSVPILHPVFLVMIMGGARFAYRSWKDGHLLSLGELRGEPVLVLGAGSDITRSPSDSGINLMAPTDSGISLEAPLELDRWRSIAQVFLAIPHHIISSALNAVSEALWVVSFFTVLFTQSIPEGISKLQVMILRYRARVGFYAAFTHASYPPFDFSMTDTDPGGTPVRIDIERTTTWTRANAFNVILAIPHYILLAVYGIGAFVLVVVNFFGVIFTGKWVASHRDFVVKVARYQTRVFAYVLMLRNEYPAFALS